MPTVTTFNLQSLHITTYCTHAAVRYSTAMTNTLRGSVKVIFLVGWRKRSRDWVSYQFVGKKIDLEPRHIENHCDQKVQQHKFPWQLPVQKLGNWDMNELEAKYVYWKMLSACKGRKGSDGRRISSKMPLLASQLRTFDFFSLFDW